MASLRRIRRGLTALLALWGVLLSLVVLQRGLRDPAARAPRPAPDPGVTAGAEAGTGAPAVVPELDAGASAATSPSLAPVAAPAHPRYRVCRTREQGRPVLSQLWLGEETRGAWAVHCGDQVSLLVFDPLADGSPRRVAQLAVQPPQPALRLRAGPLISGRLGGAGAPAVLVPVRWDDELGIPRGGRVYALPTSAGLGPPRPFVSATAVDLLRRTGPAGDALALLQLEDAKVRTPSELWLLEGGASPRRVASVPVGLGALQLAQLDLDLDGHPDLVALAEREPELTVLLDPGRTGQARREQRLPGATSLALGDLSGDGHEDLLVAGDALWSIVAETEPGLLPAAIEGSAGLRDAHVLDQDGDGVQDIVAYGHPELVLLRGLGEGRFERSVLGTLVGTGFAVLGMHLSDLDADGTLDLVLLGHPSDDPQLAELAVVRGWAAQPGAVRLSDASGPLADAPLTLEFRL